MKYIACAIVVFAGAILVSAGVVANGIAATSTIARGEPGNTGIICGLCIVGFGIIVWLYEMIPVPSQGRKRPLRHAPRPEMSSDSEMRT